jgi:hypothetical protein
MLDALVPAARRDAPGLWLRAFAYTRRVLLAGATIPWLRPAELAQFVGQTQRLLAATVVSFPLASIVSAWLEDPSAAAACTGKRRPAGTFKGALAEDGLRALTVEVLRAVTEATRPAPLALMTPDPGRWAAAVHAQVNQLSPVDVDDDGAEMAAVYVADLLRAFADCEVAGLLIDPDGATVGEGLVAPILNIARHYRWDVGLRSSPGSSVAATAPFDFRIMDAPMCEGICGIELAPGFWAGEAPPTLPDGAFYFGDVPVDAVPEALLARLAVLREAGGAR